MKRKRTWHLRALSAVLTLALTASLAVVPASAAGSTEFQSKRLEGYLTSWLGNDYPGIGENGYGEWVQNYIKDVDFVNGTVITASQWDEAGRCTGLYRDDKVNTTTLKTNPARGAWGWGTASEALAADETNIWLYTVTNDLLHFSWDYENINSHKYVGYVESPGAKAVSMTEMDGTLYALREDGTVEAWDGIALTKKAADFKIPNAKELVIDKATGELWVIVDNQIKNYDTKGKELGRAITGFGNPVNVAIDEKDGYLIVTDDGKSQQVFFYDISGTGNPMRVKTFGDLGGIGSGTPGEYKPLKFFSLKGAGTDAEGNIYVAMGQSESVIRKFAPDGTLVWEKASFPFVDSADFLPGSDGTLVYGADELYEMDYTKSYGKEATVKAITRDFVNYPGERDLAETPEGRPACNVWARVIQGKTILFMNNMYCGNSNGKMGLDMHVVDEGGYVAHYVGSFDGPDNNWAFDIDENGAIWVANDNGKIVRYDFGGFDKNGCPIYSKSNAKTYNTPSGINEIARINYDEANDKLYLFGYTTNYPKEGDNWGLIGRVLRTYQWNEGRPELLFETAMPMENDGGGNMLDPKAVDVAGDYVFVVSCRSAKVHVFSALDGEYIGTMQAEPEIGTSGWVDIPYGVHATKRSNGEYVVIVEEDWRAKNTVYRWNPDGPIELPEDEATEGTITLEKEKDIRYVNGYPDGTFRPEAGITRAEVASIFYRLIAATDKGEKKTVSFSDVSESDWYYEAVAYLENHGLISGYPDGTFGPGNSITRAEFVTIASRFDELSEGEEGQYSDVTADHWASEAILSAAAKGWVGGFPDGTFRPNDNVTRAQVVAVVNRMLGKKAASVSGEANQFTDLSEGHWAYADILEATTGE